jgi:hypothetical protein
MNDFVLRNKWVLLAAVIVALAGLQVLVSRGGEDRAAAPEQIQAATKHLPQPHLGSATFAADDSDDQADDADQSYDDGGDEGLIDNAEGYDPNPQDDGSDSSAQNESHTDGPQESVEPPPD